MWVFTTDGFYSAVAHKSEPNILVVRSRRSEDAERLADWLYPYLGRQLEVQHTPEGDYHWRLFVPRLAFAGYLQSRAYDIDYPNFKATVSDHERAAIYGNVWADLMALQHDT